MFNKRNSYYTIDCGMIRNELIELMRWNSDEYDFEENLVIYDFILLFFMAGNDFVPNIPSIEILENGMETLIECYADVCSVYGHIVDSENGVFFFRKKSMKALLETLSFNEKQLLENKINNRKSYFKDSILYKNVSLNKEDNLYKVDINSYIKDYNKTKFENIKIVSHEYFNGINWIINYYLNGVPDWNWYFPYHYCPYASCLIKHINSHNSLKRYPKTFPDDPFFQLICILPPKSAPFLPNPLNNIITKKDTPLSEYFPENFKIDLEGKRMEWEGIAIIPFLPENKTKYYYKRLLPMIKGNSIKRNKNFKFSKKYFYDENTSYDYKNYNGFINDCKIKTEFINF